MNVAYKTVTYPLGEVEAAVHGALKKMVISEKYKELLEAGVRIVAETPELTIYVDLERITNNVTKISVDVRKNFIMKDVSTATEIIVQTDNILRQMQSRPILSPNTRVSCKTLRCRTFTLRKSVCSWNFDLIVSGRIKTSQVGSV